MSQPDISAFVANVLLHAEHEPMTVNDAFIALGEWTREGVELPEGITAQRLADEFNRMIESERSMTTMKDAERILATTRAECLRGMESANMDARMAWYYTHCGEMEMASYLGAITNERMNDLEREWREHKPIPGKYPERQRDPEWTYDEARAFVMQGVADSALKLMKTARPGRNLGIAYIKPDADTIEQFTDWQRTHNHIMTGCEYFLVWDYSPDWETDEPALLYAVDVSADSMLTAAWELFGLLSRKF